MKTAPRWKMTWRQRELRLVARLFCLLLVLVASTGAETRRPVPLEISAAIFQKVHTYDALVQRDPGSEIAAAIVYRNAGDKQNAVFVAEVLDRLSRTSRAHPWRVEVIRFDEHFDAAMTEGEFTSLFLLSDPTFPKADLEAIRKLSEERQVLTMTDDPKLVSDVCIFSVDLENSHPKIWIHLDRARRSGRDFESAFLQLCRQVDR
ncbi:MAG: DUF4154 domain-containing protein [Candidatus Eisenbacteria bacterium]|nr:DUF4154 domain-containing protein [Candidatus Eisenbacteria bacterium]